MPPAQAWRRYRRGPWRVAVAEDSMTPALQPGDWLLVDPAPRRWPRRGSVVVVRQPGTGMLAIKRLAAGPGDVVLAGTEYVRLADEAWLLGDNAAVTALLDRLLHHAHVLKCGPRSWRTKTQADLRQEDTTR